MSTTTTLEVTLQSQFEVVTLVVRKSDVEVVALPERLFEKWRAEFKRRSPQPLNDERIAAALARIEVRAFVPGNRKVRSLRDGSEIDFVIPANHRFQPYLVWGDRVANIAAKVSF